MKPIFTPFFAFIFCTSLLCLGPLSCTEEEKPTDTVAQVGNSVLTLTQLQKRFPPKYQHLIKKEQYLDYIKRWMDEEILYQHAVQNSIDQKPELKENLAEVRKKMVVDHYVAQEFSDVKFRPEEAALKQYFDTHQDNFLRNSPEVRLLKIIVKNAELAEEVRKKVTGDNFSGLIEEYSKGNLPPSIGDIPFKSQAELNPCLATQAFKMRVGETSLPLKCGDEYHIIQVAERKKPGTLKNYQDVKNEIRHILVKNWQQRNLRKKIDDLKKEIYFSSNLEQVP